MILNHNFIHIYVWKAVINFMQIKEIVFSLKTKTSSEKYIIIDTNL